MFIDWYLPGYKAGGPIRSCANLIEHLAEQFDFYVVTRNADYLSNEPYENIVADTWVNSPKGNCKVFYCSKSNFSISTFKKIINEIEFDIAYINGIFSFYFSILPLFLIESSKIIVATRGMLASSALNIKSFKKQFFIKLMKLLNKYDGISFHATNAQEEKEIKSIISPSAQLKIAPNLFKKEIGKFNDIIKTDKQLKLINLARIAPEKNLLFGLEVFKDFSFEGEIILDIYGASYDKEYMNSCKSLIAQLPVNIKVHYRGTVSADKIEELISNYHFLFLPTRGENFGHAILESFTAARPVLISDKTPWKNLKELNVGWELPLNVENFREKLIYMLQMEDNEYQKMVKSVKTYAKSIVNDKSIIEQSFKLFY